MKSRIILLFSVLCFATTVYSQSFGYMGKRFILTHNGFYFPAFQAPSYRTTNGFKMNSTQSLGVEFAATHYKSLCFAAQYYLTGVNYKPLYGSPYGYFIHGEGSDVPAKLSTLQYSIGLKRFTKRMIAPIGFYLKWELIFQTYTLKYDTDGFYVNSNYPYYNLVKIDGGSGLIKYYGIGSAFSIGKQRIFAHKIVIDYGIRAALSVPLPYNYENMVERSLAGNVYDRVLNHQLFNLNLGIGFLAF